MNGPLPTAELLAWIIPDDVWTGNAKKARAAV